nr:MAG TPA: hypothetical protein [Caudoviricetes sp.]
MLINYAINSIILNLHYFLYKKYLPSFTNIHRFTIYFQISHKNR